MWFSDLKQIQAGPALAQALTGPAFSSKATSQSRPACCSHGQQAKTSTDARWNNIGLSYLSYFNPFNMVGTTCIRRAVIEPSVERLTSSWLTQLRFNVAWGPANTWNELLIGNLHQLPRRRRVARCYRTSRGTPVGTNLAGYD
jgi:hypothetical protein